MGILVGPPAADVVAVEGFDLGVDVSEDPKYLAMVAGLEAVEGAVEFCKALVVCDGNQARAGAMVFPDATAANQRQRASRLAKRPEVQALYRYFMEVRTADDGPVTRDEIKREVNKRWRLAKDKANAEFLTLTNMVMDLNGIGGHLDLPKAARGLDEALLLADEVMTGISGQARMH